MSNRNKNTNNSRKNSFRPPVPPAPKNSLPTFVTKRVQEVKELPVEIIDDVILDLELPANLSEDVLKTLFRQMEESRTAFLSAKKNAELKLRNYTEQIRGLEESRAKLVEEKESFVNSKQEFDTVLASIEKEREQNKDQHKRLSEWESDLSSREGNAKAGFLNLHKAALEQAQLQLDDYNHSLARLTAELAKTRNESITLLQTELEQIRKKAEENISEKWKVLEIEQEKFEKEKSEFLLDDARLKRDRLRIGTEAKQLDEGLRDLSTQVEKRIGIERQRLIDEKEFYKEELRIANNDKKEILKNLATWMQIAEKVGYSVENSSGFLTYIQNLEKDRNQYRDQLQNSPKQQDIERFEAMQTENDGLRNENFRLGRELTEANRKLSVSRREVVFFEDLKLEKDTLESSRNFLINDVKRLQDEIDSYNKTGEHKDSAFPICVELDKKYSKSSTPFTLNNLSTLVSELQSRITASGFYYDDRDIRSFVAGMNMSRLFILQGMSGTGKTSLPIQFAKALGLENELYETIEVQAGWRDRDDLLGYFNAFEHKFHENKFTQALYRAGTPTFENKPFFIILDEMNLSFVEQYFADFLSVMQRGVSEHWIDLIPGALAGRPAPANFDDGHRIHIPPNVWFVGTANRDETTKDIADKTYDRAHIMELPEEHPAASESNKGKPAPYTFSFDSLKKQFTLANENTKYKSEVETAWEFFKLLRPKISENLSIGWSNRLKDHLSFYLPVILASGGEWEDAVDDILSMKILRKARDRYEINEDDWKKMGTDLTDCWNEFNKTNKKNFNLSMLTRTDKLIEKELKNKVRQNR